MVERDLPKVDVASSNLVIRSRHAPPRSASALRRRAARRRCTRRRRSVRSAVGDRGYCSAVDDSAPAVASPTVARPCPRAVALLTLAGCSSGRRPGARRPPRRHRRPRAVRRRARPRSRRPTSLMEWVPAPGSGRQHGDHQRHLVPDRGVVRPGLPARRPGPVVRHRQRGRHPDHQRAPGHRLGGRGPAGPGREAAGGRRGHRPRRRARSTRSARTATCKTTAGGTWALGGDTLVHATVGPDGDYCVATVDLVSRVPSRGWCVAGQARLQRRPRHRRPAPRCSPSTTPSRPAGPSAPSPASRWTRSPAYPTAPPGRARSSATTQAVWSVIPDEADIDAAEFFARNGDDYFDLGPGTSSTLVPCADAAYFVRDPQVEGDPAQLLRWDGSTPDRGLRGAARPVPASRRPAAATRRWWSPRSPRAATSR